MYKSSNPRSSRTRIETTIKSEGKTMSEVVPTQDPAEQGLKQRPAILAMSLSFRSNPRSSRTRIET